MAKKLTLDEFALTMTKILNEFKSEFNHFKTEFSEFKTEFKELKTDFNELKTDFNELKTDFNELKTDFNELKTDFNGLKTEFKDFKKDVNIRFDKLENRVEEAHTLIRKYHGNDKTPPPPPPPPSERCNIFGKAVGYVVVDKVYDQKWITTLLEEVQSFIVRKKLKQFFFKIEHKIIDQVITILDKLDARSLSCEIFYS